MTSAAMTSLKASSTAALVLGFAVSLRASSKAMVSMDQSKIFWTWKKGRISRSAHFVVCGFPTCSSQLQQSESQSWPQNASNWLATL